MKILIVEDEEHLAHGLQFNLQAENFETVVAPDGETATDLILRRKIEFQLIVLDIMLPGISGFEVAQMLRENNVFTPIMMLTARGQPADVLRGFEVGADDYLPKPFDLSIFIARVHGLLRRQQWNKREIKNVFEFGGKKIDFDNLELKNSSETVRLTLMEANLLRHLIENAGQTVSRKTILEDVWRLHEDTDTRAIDNFIVRLRRYLEDNPTNPKHLLTVRGVGYRFNL